tara:strand:- start:1258 stop:1623 length:366 start_codon:yes stop_codon:yes gene_type:complete
MENEVFSTGKYEGKTFKFVRINHTDYFTWIVTQPTIKIASYVGAHELIDFVKYSLEFLKHEQESLVPPVINLRYRGNKGGKGGKRGRVVLDGCSIEGDNDADVVLDGCLIQEQNCNKPRSL